jgi:hypothetical protein
MNISKLMLLSAAFVISTLAMADAPKYMKIEVDSGNIFHMRSFKANTDSQEGKDQIVQFFAQDQRKRAVLSRVMDFQNAQENKDKIQRAEGLLESLISQSRYVKNDPEVLAKLREDLGFKSLNIVLHDDRLPLMDRISIGFLKKEGRDPSRSAVKQNFMKREDLPEILSTLLDRSLEKYEKAIEKAIKKEEERLYAGSQEERDAQASFINSTDMSGFYEPTSQNNGNRDQEEFEQDSSELERPVGPTGMDA